ncbi:MAG: DNA mismatch repair protein MutS [Deltaproteobacteria bacterium]|nr:DNA mismatch repair protein MutS [Deltaproteobacteria bacterium]
MAKLDTPMMKQYLAVKEQHPDALLFFRMGDFYEMFFEDAEVGSRELGLALTSRNKGVQDPVPLCGLPYHALNRYLKKLLDRGFKVAICDQVEDPRKAKGIVRREVTRVVTPGTNLEEDPEDISRGHFLVSVVVEQGFLGLGALDLGTSEFRAMQPKTPESLADEVAKLWPEEILVCEDDETRPELAPMLERIKGTPVTIEPRNNFPGRERAESLLKDRLGVVSLSGFGMDGMGAAIKAAAAVLRYAEDNQRGNVTHLESITVPTTNDYMVLDQVTVTNLELVEGLESRNREGSLLEVLDETRTPMGGRRLREWVLFPLKKKTAIISRLRAVESLAEDNGIRSGLMEVLSKIRDIDRLNTKVQLRRANARDVNALAYSLKNVAALRNLLSSLLDESGLLKEIHDDLEPQDELVATVERAIVENPPAILTEGGMFKQGFDSRLDEYIDIMEHGKEKIIDIETRERARTGISSLKVKFNKVFGYFIEVTKANLDAVPDDYIRKQTLVNAERFVTPELKDYEEKVLTAEEKRKDLERELFDDLIMFLSGFNSGLKRTAMALGMLDAITSLAETAVSRGYCKPSITDDTGLDLVDSRHPVVEAAMPEGERFVPNDIRIDTSNTTMLIVTGPNMAGKSTAMRQVALSCIMAQAGSFVPARKATLPIVDRVFTRIGASDKLSKGKSTFMVEMSETANILNNATPQSLVILDEIGRGTSTYDGLSIAWAVAEYLHDNIGCKTLFATHYHELTEMTRKKEFIRNVNIAVKEWKDSIVFLRRLVPGATNKSYGIQVARLAGLPGSVLERAKEILKNLEAGDVDDLGAPEFARTDRPAPRDSKQLSLFGVMGGRNQGKLEKELELMDLSTITPIEALNLLHKWKAGVGKKTGETGV